MKRIIFAILIAVLSVNVESDIQGQPHFHWNPVTQDAKGNPTTVTGYKMYCGSQTGVYTSTTDIPNASTTSLPVSSAAPSDGEYYCALTAYGPTGESAKSAEAHFFIVSGGVVLPAEPGAPSLWIEMS